MMLAKSFVCQERSLRSGKRACACCTIISKSADVRKVKRVQRRREDRLWKREEA